MQPGAATAASAATEAAEVAKEDTAEDEGADDEEEDDEDDGETEDVEGDGEVEQEGDAGVEEHPTVAAPLPPLVSKMATRPPNMPAVEEDSLGAKPGRQSGQKALEELIDSFLADDDAVTTMMDGTLADGVTVTSLPPAGGRAKAPAGPDAASPGSGSSEETDEAPAAELQDAWAAWEDPEDSDDDDDEDDEDEDDADIVRRSSSWLARALAPAAKAVEAPQASASAQVAERPLQSASSWLARALTPQAAAATAAAAAPAAAEEKAPPLETPAADESPARRPAGWLLRALGGGRGEDADPSPVSPTAGSASASAGGASPAAGSSTSPQHAPQTPGEAERQQTQEGRRWTVGTASSKESADEGRPGRKGKARGGAFVFAPRGSRTDTCVLYIHGGAFECNSPSDVFYQGLCSKIAAACQLPVVAPDHPLVREGKAWKAPEILRWLLSGLLWLLKHDPVTSEERATPGTVVLAGDSSGGTQALSLLLLMAQDCPEKLASVRGVAMISPWLDLTCGSPTYVSNAFSKEAHTGDVAFRLPPERNRAENRALALNYVGAEERLTDSLFSPYWLSRDLNSGVLAALEAARVPLWICVGAAETLAGEALDFAERLRGRLPVELWLHDAMFHVWVMYASRHPFPSRDAALSNLIGFIRRTLEEPARLDTGIHYYIDEW